MQLVKRAGLDPAFLNGGFKAAFFISLQLVAVFFKDTNKYSLDFYSKNGII